MKYLKLYEGYIDEISKVKRTFYHNTSRANLDSILKNGLTFNSDSNGKTLEVDHVKSLYNGVMPIFVTTNRRIFKEKDDITLVIDTDGLKLVSDIPTFEDWLDSISDIWKKVKDGYKFNSEVTPDELCEILIDDKLTYKRLLTDEKVIRQVIYLTQTAAILEDVPPSKIRIYENEASKTI